MSLVTSPIMYLQQLQPNTVVDVLNSTSPSFSGLKKILGINDGELASQAILSILLTDLVDFFNIGKSMSDTQIASTVNLILEDFSVFKPDDFILCFKRAKKGKYGKVYDRLDGQIILEWLAQYECERNAEIEDFRIIEKKRLEKNLSQKPDEPIHMPEEIKQKLAKILNKEPKHEVTVFQTTPEQQLANRFISQFDALWMLGKISSKGRFVRKYGRILNVNEYLEHKYYQLELVTKRNSQRQSLQN